MIRRIILVNDDFIRELRALYDYAERYVGSSRNVVQPIWDRIDKLVIEENEPPEATA